jgi:hypothetical protein
MPRNDELTAKAIEPMGLPCVEYPSGHRRNLIFALGNPIS